MDRSVHCMNLRTHQRFTPARMILALWVVFTLYFLGTPAGAEESSDQPGKTVRLSLDQCIAAALEKNLDITVAQYTREIRDYDLIEAESIFEPEFSSEMWTTSATNPSSSALAGSPIVTNTNRWFNLSASQFLPTGGNYSLSLGNTRFGSNSIFNTLNPYYSSGLRVDVTQPLLRNFGMDITKTNILVARNNIDISETELVERLTNTVSAVEAAYWNLVHRMEDLTVKQQSLKLAQDLLEQTQIRVEVGKQAPIEIYSAEAEVAVRDAAITASENSLLEAEDELRRLMNVEEGTNWDTRIIPTDAPELPPVESLDADASLAEALRNRPDYQGLKLSLENANLNAGFAKNQLLPGLDLVGYWGSSGIAGRSPAGTDFLGNPIPASNEDFLDALSDTLHARFKDWGIGFRVSIPLHNRAARSRYEKARLSQLQTEANIRNLELLITYQVRSAVRAVEASRKQIEQARIARVLEEQKLSAEEQRYEHGLSTAYDVLRFQEDLAAARTFETRAILDLRISLVALKSATGSLLEDRNIVLDMYR